MAQQADTTGIMPGAALNGVLRNFDATNWQADVQLTGSFPTYITGIAVNRGLNAAAITAGRRCIVAFNDLQNPQRRRAHSGV